MPQRTLAILQHEKNEPGGLFEEFAGEMGIGIVRVPIYETNEIPPISSTHLLVMGGPMSVNDEEVLPWLKAEKQVIREWVAKGRPVLGICLGAQLIASSFGGAVHPCREELGWWMVTAVMDGVVPGLPQTFPVFQMHGETFEIPCGGVLAYRGQKVRHQGICMGSALGLQFHLEVTLDMIQDWISNRPQGEQASILTESRQYLHESLANCRTLAERSCPLRPVIFHGYSRKGETPGPGLAVGNQRSCGTPGRLHGLCRIKPGYMIPRGEVSTCSYAGLHGKVVLLR